MEYVKVQDEQIAEVGFGDGLYGPETLGIIFQPNKKQKAAEQPGSEYHYGGVGSRKYQAIVAATEPHVPFKAIKSDPSLYPYEKVEAGKTYDTPLFVDPPQPRQTTQDSVTGTPQDSTWTDAPSPGSALAKIDGLKPEFVFVPGNMDTILQQIREQALAMVAGLNISTPKMRKQIKDVKNLVVKSRTYIEKMRLGYVSAEKKRLATVDGEARRIREIFEGIEEEVARPLTEWEAQEQYRVDVLSKCLSDINGMQPHVYPTIPELEAAIAKLESIDPAKAHEYQVPIAQAKEQALAVLTAELTKRRDAEAQQAELAKLRAESTARAEADRLAQVVKEAGEQAERAAEAEAVRLQRAAEDAETRREIAEAMRIASEQASARRAEEAAAQAKRDQEAAVEAERKRAADEAAREDAAKRSRAADKENRVLKQNAAIQALIEHTEASPDVALTVIEAIAKGLIPHVTITY